ncbi:MAG: hypothetical protein HRU75_12925 [Planctomycetia bacterium]|nr:MAG: hypothetical protein HRU75_12925 [Planctomycetia bacterium]
MSAGRFTSDSRPVRAGRRVAPRRVAHHTPCRIRLDEWPPTWLHGHTVAIGADGVTLIAPRDATSGLSLEVMVHAPGTGSRTLTGVIRSTRRVMSGTYEWDVTCVADESRPAVSAGAPSWGALPAADSSRV